MSTAGDVRSIALGFPEAREAAGAFTVRKAVFARLLDDAEVALHVDLDERDRLLEADPDTFRVTPRFMTEPFVVVRLARIDRARLDDLLFEAWRRCAPPAISRHPAGSRPRPTRR